MHKSLVNYSSCEEDEEELEDRRPSKVLDERDRKSDAKPPAKSLAARSPPSSGGQTPPLKVKQFAAAGHSSSSSSSTASSKRKQPWASSRSSDRHQGGGGRGRGGGGEAYEVKKNSRNKERGRDGRSGGDVGNSSSSPSPSFTRHSKKDHRHKRYDDDDYRSSRHSDNEYSRRHQDKKASRRPDGYQSSSSLSRHKDDKEAASIDRKRKRRDEDYDNDDYHHHKSERNYKKRNNHYRKRGPNELDGSDRSDESDYRRDQDTHHKHPRSPHYERKVDRQRERSSSGHHERNDGDKHWNHHNNKKSYTDSQKASRSTPPMYGGSKDGIDEDLIKTLMRPPAPPSDSQNESVAKEKEYLRKIAEACGGGHGNKRYHRKLLSMMDRQLNPDLYANVKKSDMDELEEENNVEKMNASSSSSISSTSTITVARHPSNSSNHSTDTPKSIESFSAAPLPTKAAPSASLFTTSTTSTITAAAATTIPTSSSTSSAVQITLPSYYNSNMMNPTRYAQQMQKRKLLWGSKKTDEKVVGKWEKAQFSEDTDGKVASKFLRLMGIKNSTNSSGGGTQANANNGKCNGDKDNDVRTDKQSNTKQIDRDIKTREEMFSTMEQQYEVARMTTHTMRGVGLGFATQTKNY